MTGVRALILYLLVKLLSSSVIFRYGDHIYKYRLPGFQNENCTTFTQKNCKLTDLTVIIVHFKTPFHLDLCLQSLDASKGVNLDIIVVDNDSGDLLPDDLINRYDKVTWLLNRRNLGFGAGINAALHLIRSEHVLILNPDTILGESTLHNAMGIFATKPDIGAIGIRFIDGTGHILPEAKRNLPTPQIALQKLMSMDSNYYATHLNATETGEVEVLTGAFLLMKTNLIQDLNGFDEHFFMYGEDIDLCLRIKQSGYRLYYLGSQRMIHFKGESQQKDSAYYRNFYGAMSIYFKKHYPSYGWLVPVINGLARLMTIWNLAGGCLEPRKDRIGKWMYMGKDDVLFKRLVKTLSGTGQKVNEIRNPSDVDVVYFDSRTMSFDDILEHYERPDLMRISKRIIDKKGNFYLGSDSPTSQGEITDLSADPSVT